MLNRFLLQLLKMRGVRVTKTHQENKGGNADHFNLLYRFEHKEKSKSETLKKFLDKNDATQRYLSNTQANLRGIN